MAKYWRDAASVIITSKSVFLKEASLEKLKKLTDVATSRSKNIKEKDLKESTGFKILTLKRSAGSSFMPSTYVFPGGVVNAADCKSDWIQIFERNGVLKEIEEFCRSEKENKDHLIFQSKSSEEIPKTLSLRITGIRETFEECGVLFCKQKAAHPSNSSKWASYISGHDLNEWQKQVQADPLAFHALCRHFHCYPDVWAMNYWSNWLTPSSMPKRFNTAFFLALVDHMPPVTIDNGEVNDVKWCAPSELLELCENQKIRLPPPQFYELSRLNSFKDIEQLVSFATSKTNRPKELWMPFHIYATDGDVTILPGDDGYPSDIDITAPTKQKKVDVTMMELTNGCNKLHRIEYNSNGVPTMVIK